jgi:sec-independent protein translocase protein TatA
MGSLGGWEIFWIVLAVLILFGAKRIPEMMKAMGQGVKEFKKAAKEISTPEETTPAAPSEPKNNTQKPA